MASSLQTRRKYSAVVNLKHGADCWSIGLRVMQGGGGGGYGYGRSPKYPLSTSVSHWTTVAVWTREDSRTATAAFAIGRWSDGKPNCCVDAQQLLPGAGLHW